MDPNIGRLLRRLVERNVPFKELIVGPDCSPSIAVGLDDLGLTIDGQPVHPSSAFVRHDVFWAQQNRENSVVPSATLNWFYAIRGWVLTNNNVRCFNRFSSFSENNKIYNLHLARKCGLKLCETLIATLSAGEVNRYLEIDAIVKPVAGGSLTIELQSALSSDKPETCPVRTVDYPRFIQPKLNRPELRIFGVGGQSIAFSILSEDLDYREKHQAEIEMVESPKELISNLKGLADALELTFYAADFMRDEANDFVFLEINTQPMFSTFDKISEGKITDAIISFLEPGSI